MARENILKRVRRRLGLCIEQHFINSILEYCKNPLYHNKQPADYLSIVACIKDEAPYLHEWIEYHKLVGVSKFYLYDAATDNTRDVLEPYIKSGEVVYVRATERGIQLRCYNDFLSKYRWNSQWAAIIDADEYIVPADTESTLPKILNDFEKYPAVGVNWVMYDSNGHDKKPDGLITRNYTRTYAERNHPTNRHIKSIINPRKVLFCPNPHFCMYTPLSRKRHAVTENFEQMRGSIFDGKSLAFTKQNSIRKIRINHYYSKSKEEFEKKASRGLADYKSRYITVTEDKYNFPETMMQDTIMHTYIHTLEERISKIDLE